MTESTAKMGVRPQKPTVVRDSWRDPQDISRYPTKISDPSFCSLPFAGSQSVQSHPTESSVSLPRTQTWSKQLVPLVQLVQLLRSVWFKGVLKNSKSRGARSWWWIPRRAGSATCRGGCWAPGASATSRRCRRRRCTGTSLLPAPGETLNGRLKGIPPTPQDAHSKGCTRPCCMEKKDP